MARIKKLENHYQKQLTEHQVEDVSEFIQSILNADITKGKYARFLIESFLNDQFLEEDLMGGLDSTVGQAIFLFDKHKGKLPVKQRSVYALNPETGKTLYQSPGDLWNSVKQYQGELSGKELKKEEQEQIYRETEFIYKDEETGFQIVSPLTENSAKWWGKGTRWCTSAEKNNMFYDYAKDAPLLILLLPASASPAGNGDKLQLWKNGNNVQFMDEADNDVSLNYIEKNWNILEPICLWLNDLRFIPKIYLTQERCKMILQNNGYALQYVPVELRTKEFCELAVKNSGKALQYVPVELRTKELYELAVKQNGRALSDIPNDLRTKELCELAVKQNGEALLYTPDKYKTKELCELAIQNNGIALYHIEERLRTKELCKLAIQSNFIALLYTPDTLKTPELCELAVKQNGMALLYVPDHLITTELCELAVKNTGKALRYVPKHLKTQELCETAIHQNGCALLFSKNIYTNCFSEIQNLFPQNSISLDIK